MSATRTVKLTENQFQELQRSQLERRALGDTLMKLVQSVSDRLAEQEMDFWDQVHAIAGTEPFKAEIMIRWISGDLVITQPVESDE
jgi:hypothetical protein